ncbi:MAG: glycosyltransferase family 2 protein [Oscillospiraceae bacterium]|nr:glycosyltransferase family 2 protein [Oscillospiraceae bacterium]
MKLSMVVPCYNEALSVVPFLETVLAAFEGCGYEYELIFVNDGSTDATGHQLRKLYEDQTCPIKVVELSRNFGKEAAIYAGLRHADGAYISLIDADLQQPPALVREMVDILDCNRSYDVVAAYQDKRKESKLLTFFKNSFYKTINLLSDVHFRHDASDFRTFRRSVAESILTIGEYHRFSKGIFSWIGYETSYIPYVAAPRVGGRSKWSFRKLFGYAIDGIVGFSIKPLRIATFLGCVTSFAAFLYLVSVFLEKIFRGIDVPGYATQIILILLLGGIQLLCIGIIGEYVGRIFEQSKRRPIYIEKDVLDYHKK